MWVARLGALLRAEFIENKPTVSLPTLPVEIELARRDWLYAQRYYDEITDEDLIDYAIYFMKMCEKKYLYLLKKAKREGVTYSPYPQQ